LKSDVARWSGRIPFRATPLIAQNLRYLFSRVVKASSRFPISEIFPFVKEGYPIGDFACEPLAPCFTNTGIAALLTFKNMAGQWMSSSRRR
jgi:hypothetical protein